MRDDYCVYYRTEVEGKSGSTLLTDMTYSEAQRTTKELKSTLGRTLKSLIILREEEDLSPID